MTHSHTIEINGAVVLYRMASRTDRGELQLRFDQLGIKGKLPKRRDMSVLREALTEMFPKHIIRTTLNRGELEVVAETKHAQANDYRHIAFVKIDPETGAIIDDDMDIHDRAVLEQQIQYFDNQLTGAEVSRALVAIVSELGGTPLRESGAVYWLPAAQVDRWEAIGNAVEMSASAGCSRVYAVKTVGDENSIRAIIDAITTEVEAVAESVEADLSDDPTKRVLINRQNTLDQTRHKMKRYESILRTKLTEASDALDKVSDTAAGVEILLSGDCEFIQ